MPPRGIRVSPSAAAGTLVAVGLAWRVVLTGLGVPRTNSDEALIGLMATDIADGVAAPAFVYGQHYMGSIEAWLAAPIIWFAGPSVPAVRVSTTVAFAIFAVLLYRLVARLYSPWFAVLVVGLLALGSDRAIKDQLIANGFAWIVPGCAALLWGALRLARPGNQRGLRLSGFAGWGLVAGLVVWTDWLALPYVLAAVVLLVSGCRRRLFGPAGWLVVAGFVLGVAPQLAHDLTGAVADNSALAYVNMAFGQDSPGQPPSAVARLHGGLLLGVPMRMGLCGPGSCSPLVQVLGPAAVVSLAGAVVFGSRKPRHQGRLALAVPGLLTVGLYVVSTPAGVTPVESVRYLCCLVISLPVILRPLWRAACRTWWAWSAWPARAVIAVVVVSAAAASLAVVPTIGGHRQAAADERVLVAELGRRGIDRLYTDYWTCQRLMFATRGRIACASVTTELRRGADKLPGARSRVDAAPTPAYLFPVGKAEAAAFDEYLQGFPGGSTVRASAVEVVGHRLYVMERRLPVPIDEPGGSTG